MKQTAIIMGMPVTIEVVDAKNGAADIYAAFSWFREVDERFSTYKDYSEICRLNRGDISTHQLSTQARLVFEQCEEMRKRTNGFFDIRRPDGILDPSGLVKGWAIGQAAKLLDERGVANYCLNVGGDMFVSGNNSKGDPWTIGIASPYERNTLVKRLRLQRGAIATSGAYERGDHIYDPHTGVSSDTFASVTIVGPDIMIADVYATAVFAMGKPGLDWITLQAGYEAYVVTSKHSATSTPGLVAFAV